MQDLGVSGPSGASKANSDMYVGPRGFLGSVILLCVKPIRGTCLEKDPLNKVPCQRAISRVQKSPLLEVSLILDRTSSSQSKNPKSPKLEAVKPQSRSPGTGR